MAELLSAWRQGWGPDDEWEPGDEVALALTHWVASEALWRHGLSLVSIETCDRGFVVLYTQGECCVEVECLKTARVVFSMIGASPTEQYPRGTRVIALASGFAPAQLGEAFAVAQAYLAAG